MLQTNFTKPVNTAFIWDRIRSMRLTIDDVADALDLKPLTVNNRLSGLTEFKLKEIRTLAALLHFTAEDVETAFFS